MTETHEPATRPGIILLLRNLVRLFHQQRNSAVAVLESPPTLARPPDSKLGGSQEWIYIGTILLCA
ncbi:hypothetical protein PIB30_044571 [Stylosanthes scabra]|uniref:Uncharacterized protein n=1 Tax=Stylosanthes scabra TaxID=79078 RepID=A0ABU6WDY7_9FABA|nr:hypothetical protein [Stylosanthes scabra]